MKLTIAMLLVLLMGCSSNPAEECRERSPSITRGVYGCVASLGDLGEPELQARANVRIDVYVSSQKTGAEPKWQTTTDSTGFYQLELPEGSYRICEKLDCTDLHVGPSGAVRKDQTTGSAPGWGGP